MTEKIMKYISRKLMNLSQIFEEPGIISAMKKGIVPSYVREVYTIKKMTKIIPKTIIDVGGHQGDMAKAMNYVFPDAKIHSFEPIKSTYEKLKNNVRKIENISSYNFALGDSSKKCLIWMNQFSAASSLLNAKKEREKIFEVTKNKKKIEIEMERFDKLKEIKIEKPLYLKIDVEGAEKFVLEGMGELIKNVDILQVEYNIKKLYENQTELKDILKYVRLANLPSFIQLNNHVTEKGIIYCDLIFFRREDLKK